MATAAVSNLDPEGFVYDPFAPDVMRDPFPYYKVLRDKYPIYRLEQYDAWAISRHEDVLKLLTDPQVHLTTTEGTLMSPPMFRRHNHGKVPAPRLDPMDMFPNQPSPYYEQVRQASIGPLRPNAVRELEGFIRTRVRERLDELIARGRFNATVEFGGYISSSVACKLAGLPLSEAPRLLELVNRSTSRNPERGGFADDYPETAAQLMGMLTDLARSRRKAGADGSNRMVDGLLNLEINGRRLTDEEIASHLIVIMVGATETLPKVVGAGLLQLWRNPQQRTEVLADLKANVPIAFEEMLRYGAPAQWFSRTLVDHPYTIRETTLMPGHRVIILFASANRDERVFENADRFIWNRAMESHLAFGYGMHFCVGVHVARLEGRIMIEEVLSRIPDYAIDESQVRRMISDFQLGWMQVPLVVR
jgi:cytochrome P450